MRCTIDGNRIISVDCAFDDINNIVGYIDISRFSFCKILFYILLLINLLLDQVDLERDPRLYFVTLLQIADIVFFLY